MSGPVEALRALAWGAGVATGYHDIAGAYHQVPVDTLRALLAALGLPAGSDDEVAEAHHTLHRRHWDALTPSTTVCWSDEGPTLEVRRAVRDADATVAITIELEGGGERRVVVAGDDLAEIGGADADGSARVAHRVPLGELPLGAHRAVVETAGRRAVGHLLVAPRSAPPLARGWGVFAPVYALRRAGEHRVGHLGDLAALSDWVARLGGDVVGTLPLLATFDDDSSPYAPVSRLAWNERHLDLAALPEAAGEPSIAGGTLVGDATDLIDWAPEVTRVRAALATLVGRLSATRRAELDAFTAVRPLVDELARWRSEVEQHGPPAPGQPLTAEAPDAVLRHRYAQWAMETQLAGLADRLDRRGQSLYLDLPLGVHPSGFDVWRAPELFAAAVSVGAPPDDFFTGGQDWGFPPLLTPASQADGHGYLRAALAHQLRHAGVVRFDHVMALHRLWWIPNGAPATDGAYVHYPADELAAVLSLEAWRAGAAVVGENLGTVPPEVNDLLAGHRLFGMYATQFELDAAPHARSAPASTVAVVNTHDMEPFATYWSGADQGRRDRILEQLAADGQRADSDSALDVLEALLGWLGQSDAASVVVTLEDLWGEERRQNRPGTGAEEPNWRRRTTRTIEDLDAEPAIVRRLGRLRAARGVGESE